MTGTDRSTSTAARAEAADRAEIAGLVETFFAAFTSGPGLAERLDALPGLFLPQARIVRACGDLAVYDVAGFVAPRRELLLSGTLEGFHEWAEEGRTDLGGDVAAHVTAYAKEWTADGVRHTGRGVKVLHFVRTAAGWRISAAAWDDERSD